MLEPYSKARLINTTLNHRTKPFKLPSIIYWGSRFVTNILRWVFIVIGITNPTIRIIALCCLSVWPLILFFTVSIKQMISCCKQQSQPFFKVVIIFFLSNNILKIGLLEATFELPAHFICFTQQTILQYTIFGYLFDENQVKIRDFIRFWTEFIAFLIIGSVFTASWNKSFTVLYVIIVVLEVLISIPLAFMLKLLHKSEEIKY
jgi:hypothetical protein